MIVSVLISGTRHPVTPEPDAPCLELDIRCPACDAEELRVIGLECGWIRRIWRKG